MSDTSAHRTLLERRQNLVPRGLFNAHPVFISAAHGARLRDVDGKEYVDLTSGIGVTNLGHGHPAVIAALEEQSHLFLHTCFQVGMYPQYLELAERLHALTPGEFAKKTFFATSGAEAVEGAVKFARAYTKRDAIISFHYAFHGRTFYALQLTGRASPYRVGFGSLGGEVYRVPFPYPYRSKTDLAEACVQASLDALEELFVVSLPPQDFAAVLFEPILGEGGVVVPPPDFFRRLAAICRQHGILLIADEVQTGVGRIGTFCASTEFGVEPDLVAMAKSLGFGLPLAAVIGRAEVMDALEPGGLGGTLGGNPVACSVALAGLNALDREDLYRRARTLGAGILERLARLQQECALVGDVRGLGLMIGIELVTDRSTKRPAAAQTEAIATECRDNGVLLLYGGPLRNVLRLLPPLTIGEDELGHALTILEEAVRKISRH